MSDSRTRFSTPFTINVLSALHASMMPKTEQIPTGHSSGRRSHTRTKRGANPESLGQPRLGQLRNISPPPFYTIPPLVPRSAVAISDTDVKVEIKQEDSDIFINDEEIYDMPESSQRTQSTLATDRNNPAAVQNSSWKPVRGVYPSLIGRDLSYIKNNLFRRGFSATRAQTQRIKAGLDVLTPREAAEWVAQGKRERWQASQDNRSQNHNLASPNTATQTVRDVQEVIRPGAHSRRSTRVSDNMDVDIDHNRPTQPIDTSTNTDQILRQVIQKYKDEVAFLKGVLQDQGVNEGMLDEIEARIKAGEQRAAAVKHVVHGNNM